MLKWITKSHRRLQQVWEAAERVAFDNSSKIVFFSDCHRGDGSTVDDFAKNRNMYMVALSYYYDQCFTYIELGDGDELWKNKNFRDIINTHSDAYQLLSELYNKGRLYMVFGNHDVVKGRAKWRDKNLDSFLIPHKDTRVPLLPGIEVPEGLVLRRREDGSEIFLAHGHQADFLNDDLWKLARFLVRYMWRPLEALGVKDPTSAARNHRKKKKVELKLMNWCEGQGRMMIAGHTHQPRFPQPGEARYFNDGSCVHPRCVTAIEIEQGAISLVKWSVGTKEDGVLYVKRDTLQGPVPLDDYFTAGDKTPHKI